LEIGGVGVLGHTWTYRADLRAIFDELEPYSDQGEAGLPNFALVGIRTLWAGHKEVVRLFNLSWRATPGDCRRFTGTNNIAGPIFVCAVSATVRALDGAIARTFDHGVEHAEDSGICAVGIAFASCAPCWSCCSFVCCGAFVYCGTFVDCGDGVCSTFVGRGAAGDERANQEGKNHD